jgi:ribosomal protein S18 acetylase RimI-like enzyme
MSNTFTYRLATSADTQLLIDYRILLLDYVSHTTHTADVVQKLRDDLAVYFPKAIADGSYIAWLAYDGDTIAAVSGMVIYDRPASYKCPTGRIGYILNIYTNEQYRRQGISTRLMDRLYESAKDSDVSVLMLHASPDGEGVYRRFGFEDPGTPVLEMQVV